MEAFRVNVEIEASALMDEQLEFRGICCFSHAEENEDFVPLEIQMHNRV